MGFGFIEIGSVCPKPQPGNPKPRVFRLEEDQAVINRYGFNSDGADKVITRLNDWREYEKQKNTRGIIGVNLGKNKTTENAETDFVTGVHKLGSFSDYLVINVSSPNTPNLRDLQEEAVLKNLIIKVQTARDSICPKTPVLIKIAPDLTDLQKVQIASVAKETQVDGIIISNTTISRSSELTSPHKTETGGLSGKPLFEISTKVLSDMYQLTSGTIPLIGVGGVSSGQDALEKIKAGATLVQLYTVLALNGPSTVDRIKNELTESLKREGFNNISEVIGCNHKHLRKNNEL